MAGLPSFVNQVRVPQFSTWLAAHGVEVLSPTNEYEVLRFRARGEISVVYRNKKGQLRWTGHSEAAYRAYAGGKAWNNDNKVRRRGRKTDVQTLLERDGDRCFFCLGLLTNDDITREHVIPVAHGGPDHISNMVLAHRKCNEEAGHLSGREKIEIHVQARFARAANTEKHL